MRDGRGATTTVLPSEAAKRLQLTVSELREGLNVKERHACSRQSKHSLKYGDEVAQSEAFVPTAVSCI